MDLVLPVWIAKSVLHSYEGMAVLPIPILKANAVPVFSTKHLADEFINDEPSSSSDFEATSMETHDDIRPFLEAFRDFGEQYIAVDPLDGSECPQIHRIEELLEDLED